MRAYQLWTLFSLASCASIKRPDSNLCFINVTAARLENITPHKECLNLSTDYDELGLKLSTATAKVSDLNDLSDLDRTFSMDAKSFANLKAYIQKLRDYYANKGN